MSAGPGATQALGAAKAPLPTFRHNEGRLKPAVLREIREAERAAFVTSAEPRFDIEPYPVIAPGTYLVRGVKGRVYHSKRLKAWKALVMFASVELAFEGEVAAFFHLGRAEKARAGRHSRYLKAWMMANGGRPKRNDRLTPRVFAGKVFRVEIGDVKKRYAGGEHDKNTGYSVVKKIVEMG